MTSEEFELENRRIHERMREHDAVIDAEKAKIRALRREWQHAYNELIHSIGQGNANSTVIDCVNENRIRAEEEKMKKEKRRKADA